ncbi:helix-turn-helix domain-containing protein [Kineococcus gynurae]|uniref:Helix-turn-helix domain-containing protein n=1 Tax=Kineococcus gynurae TaxID=452979 RepID=A0ABV5LX41_9ACTN
MTVEVETAPGVPAWTLGWRLQRALAFADVSAGEMADELGVSRQTLSRWMGDKSPIRPIYVKQWALKTGVDAQWLQNGEAPRPAGPDEGLREVRQQGLEPRTR